MRYSKWASAIIGLSVLCLSSCSVSRQATSSSEELRTTELRSTETRDSVTIKLRDTLKEVTTITIDRNDVGDTLKVVQVTDRTRASVRDSRAAAEVRIVERTDTVYVAVRDSVSSSSTSEATGFKIQDSGSKFVSALKWIFWILIGLMGLIITVKVCLRKW